MNARYKNWYAILPALALLLAAPLTASAQHQAPTPGSVAPNFRTPAPSPLTTGTGGTFLFPTSSSRAGKWDFYLLAELMFSYTNTVRNVNAFNRNGTTTLGDVNMRFRSAMAYGFGGGYNFTDHLLLTGQFSFSSPRYTASFADSQLSGRANTWTGDLMLKYNFTVGKFTPYMGLGLGFEYIDTGIPTGNTNYFCWWDNWWGIVCSGSTPTASRTLFTLGGVAGLRYNITPSFFPSLEYGARWIQAGSRWFLSNRISLGLNWTY